MAFSARQISVSAAVPLLVAGTTGTQFRAVSGNIGDPLPVSIKNEGSGVVWIGGPDVSATTGQSLNAGQSMVVNLYGGDIPYAFAAATTTVSVLAGRQ